jgi:hypothetical protein
MQDPAEGAWTQSSEEYFEMIFIFSLSPGKGARLSRPALRKLENSPKNCPSDAATFYKPVI